MIAASIITVLLVILCTILFFQRRKKYGKFKLPPGPIGIPFFGYIPFLSDKAYKDMDKLRHQYGDVFGVTLGTTYTVVIGTIKCLKECYAKDAFLGRPEGFFHLSNEYTSVVAMSGGNWSEHSKFTSKALKVLGLGKNKVADMVADNISRVLEKLDRKDQCDINVRNELMAYINNTILSLLNGKTYKDGDAMVELMDEFKEVQHVMDATSLAQNNPYLRPLLLYFSPILHKVMQAVKMMESHLREDIESHEKHLDENELHDFIYHFLSEIKRRGGSKEFNKGTLLGTSQALIFGGTDTTRTSLEWAFLEMAKRPEIQKTVHAEIVEIIGYERGPTWEDKGTLPYTEAVLLESWRVNTVLPLAVLRETLEDTKANGFDIPKGTQVISNFWAMHRDPATWKDPENFLPERFLTDSGQIDQNTASQVLTFGYGKRSCPGEKLAQVQVFLFFTSILQRFKILTPEDGLKMDSFYRMSRAAEHPVVRIERR